MSRDEPRSNVKASAADLRRWVAGRALAAQRERIELRRRPPSPEEALRRGCSLWRLVRELDRRPPLDDDPEGLEFHFTWARLRRVSR